MSFFGRAIGGGIAGGLLTGDLGGIAGGAAAGGLGGWAIGKTLADRTTGMFTGGMGMIGDAALRATSTIGKRGAFNAARRMDRGITRAASFLGKNQLTTNKVGGAAMTALGTGAGIHIGSSVLASNRRY